MLRKSVFIKIGLVFFLITGFFSANTDPIFGVDFAISNLVVGSNDEIEVDATISGLTSSSCSSDGCYLRGRLKKTGGDRYFGYTLNSLGEWFDYTSSIDLDYIKNNFFNFQPVLGVWSGKLKVKNNITDPVYQGPSDYVLDFQRFSGKSDGAAGTSSPLVVQLTLPLPTPMPTSSPTPTPSFLPTPIPIPTPTLVLIPTPTLIAKAKAIPKPTDSNPQVLAAREELKPSSTPIVSAEKVESTKKFPVVAGILIVAGVVFVSLATLPFIRMRLKGYNEKHGSGRGGEEIS